jgi:hypothetical protein
MIQQIWLLGGPAVLIAIFGLFLSLLPQYPSHWTYELYKDDIFVVNRFKPWVRYSSRSLYDTDTIRFSPVERDHHCRIIQQLASRYFDEGEFSLSLIRILQRVSDLMIDGERFGVGEVERREDIFDVTLFHKEIDVNANIVTVRSRVSLMYVKPSRWWITLDGHRVIFSTKTLLPHVQTLVGSSGSRRVKFVHRNIEYDGVACIPPNCPRSVSRVTCWFESKLVT